MGPFSSESPSLYRQAFIAKPSSTGLFDRRQTCRTLEMQAT